MVQKISIELIQRVLRSLLSGDIGCFPFATSGGDQREDDSQPGYGDCYIFDFLLFDHFCGESHLCAGRGAAEVLNLPGTYS